ncbi:MAG TPA: mismatch-specific DNA-glycosylase [Kiloniellales bacterium]|nr:mismatch-specific DNA-glycosylase [Kiloniellales bacterium]
MTARRRAPEAPVLPDVLRPGLRVVFCGTAAGPTSARLGQYYARPGNRFWETLHRVGLTPERLAPADYPRVLEFGIGLTDVVKFASGVDRDLDPEHLGELAREALHRRILAVAPRFLAFTSKRAALVGLGEIEGYGLQRQTLGETRLWVLPSPSGAAVRWWDERPWRDLARQVPSPEGDLRET